MVHQASKQLLSQLLTQRIIVFASGKAQCESKDAFSFSRKTQAWDLLKAHSFSHVCMSMQPMGQT